MLGVIFGAMAVMLVLTVPIGVMLLAVALIPSLMDPGFMATVPFVLRNVVGGLNSTPLLAIPLFILGGIIMAQSGIAKRLFDVFAYLIGDKTGRDALRIHHHLPVLRGNLRFRPGYHGGCRHHDDPCFR